MNYFITYIENKIYGNVEDLDRNYLLSLAVRYPSIITQFISNYPLTKKQRRELAKGVGKLGDPYYISLISEWYVRLDYEVNDFIIVGLMEARNWELFNRYYAGLTVSTPVISSHAARLNLVNYISDIDPLKNLYGAMDGEHMELFEHMMNRYLPTTNNREMFLTNLLNKAVKKNKLEFVKVLVEKYGAKLTQENLTKALEKSSFELIKYIADSNKDLRINLLPVAYNNRWDIFKRIVETYRHIDLNSLFIVYAAAVSREDWLTYHMVDNGNYNVFNFAFLGSLASRNSNFTHYLKDLINESELKRFLKNINKALHESSYSYKNPYLLYLSLFFGGYIEEAMKVYELYNNTSVPLVKAASIVGVENVLDKVLNKDNASTAILYLSIMNRGHLLYKYIGIALQNPDYESLSSALHYLLFFGYWEIADTIINKMIEDKYKLEQSLLRELRTACELTRHLDELNKLYLLQ